MRIFCYLNLEPIEDSNSASLKEAKSLRIKRRKQFFHHFQKYQSSSKKNPPESFLAFKRILLCKLSLF
jgi:hypothetical protein